MELSKVLDKLLEAADLSKMVEELMIAESIKSFSPTSLSGLRTTLRNIQQTILTAHDAIADDLVYRARDREIITLHQPLEETPTPAQTTEQSSALRSLIEKTLR